MMRRAAFCLACLAAAPVSGAQQVSFRERGQGHAAALIDSVTARPHVVRTGAGALVLPRDSIVTASLLVIGRSAYVASVVHGDVVVVGGDLFLRPGSRITGRAVAIGGTVAETSLGQVDGTVQSFRDETFVRAPAGAPASADRTLTLTARALAVPGDDTRQPAIRLGGLHGLGLPAYDRVDGLSLPLELQAVSPGERAVAALSLTYRSRLGAFDPGAALRIGADTGVRLELRAARETQTSDRWITSDLVNSLNTLAFGTDTRNYFRTDRAEARLVGHLSRPGFVFEPWAGGRFERVAPVTATGDVFTFFERDDSLKARRPNPLVEPGHIGSALVGMVLDYAGAAGGGTGDAAGAAPLTSRVELTAEQSVKAPPGTTNFTQLTLDGRLDFPTFGLQRLRFRGHVLGTLGDSAPRARYGYLGGSRSLGLSDLLRFGGDQVVFLESRYYIPLAGLVLPVVGSPTFQLIHRVGGAGVHSVGALQQEVGAGIAIGPPGIASLALEVITGASGQHRTDFGVGLSIAAF